MTDLRKSRNPFFHLAALFSALFVLTILALTASIFADPRSTLAVFLSDHGGGLIAAEVAAILVSGFLALAIDRRQTLRARKSQADSQHVEKRP